MGILDSIKKRFNGSDKKEESRKPEKKPIPRDVDKTVKSLKDIFKDCDDVIFREFNVGIEQKYKFTLVCVDGLSDKMLINDFILNSLMLAAREVKPSGESVKSHLFELVKNGTISVTEIRETDDLNDTVTAVLSADTVVYLDGYDTALVIGTKSWPARGPQEPKAEGVVRGPSDGFVETLRFNTALVRRRIRDPRFKIKQKQVGVRSNTDIAILYIEDIVNKDLLQRLNERLEDIEIDGILESGYIEQLIEDNLFSPFPQMQSTERPDAVAGAILEGRIGIIVDNSPFALIVPTTLSSLFMSPEDYYQRWLVSSFVRVIRVIAGLLSLILPAMYIAITSYQPDIIPTRFALAIAGSREGVPFPAFIEAFLMEITLELLREAGVRLPDPLGATIGIVGGIVIGQAAVTAKIVSPVMVIIVSITAISSFVIPNYGVTTGFRLIRFGLMVLATVFGLYGIMLGIIATLIHLVNLKSFGIPYLAPFVSITGRDFKDSVVRLPLRTFIYRPDYLHVNNKKRMKRMDLKNRYDYSSGKGGNEKE